MRLISFYRDHADDVTVSVVVLRELATDITTALTSQLITPKLRQAIGTLREADGSSPPPPSTRQGPAVCSRRSSRCWTTTC